MMLRAWEGRGLSRFYDPNLHSLRHFSAATRRLWLDYFR